jgi:hypothetical protein
MEALGKGDSLARSPLLESDPPRIGRYRLTARLGAGGMGVVYLAEPDPAGQAPAGQGHPGPGDPKRHVAVKVLRPELADDPELRLRFGREVSTLLRVRGDCTVRVIEADTEAARPFLVTEYAHGPSLSEHVGAYGPLGADMLYGLATGLAEALTAIHATGVAHRDLKPSNVLLTRSGPKVIDFGIAQVLDATSVTGTGITIGSAGFMAPEQITGRAGTAADVFAWAVTVGYAASGQSPFGTGEPLGIMYRILHAEPNISAVPSSLRPLVAAALAKEPKERPSARDLLTQLTSVSARPGRGGSATQAVLLKTWQPAAANLEVPRADVKVPPAGHQAPNARPAARRRTTRRTTRHTAALSLAVLLAAAGVTFGLTLTGRPAAPAAKPMTSPRALAAPAPARQLAQPRRSSPATTERPAAKLTKARRRPATSPHRKPKPKPTATATAPATLPVITAGDYTGTEPTQITFNANSGNVVTGIDWTTWSASGATGAGQSAVDACLPACVQAPLPVATTIVLSDPVHGQFTELAETRAGNTVTYHYPANWPVSAS